MILPVLTILGISLGSFVNALVWRMHEQDNSYSKFNKKDLSIVTGRSMCTHCGHTLQAKDLIPIASWLSLQGKCRYCKKRIPDTPVAEIVTPFLFVFSYLVWPYGFGLIGTIQFVIWLILVVGFMALGIYDLKWKLLPNRIVYVLISLVAFQVALEILVGGGMARFTGALWGVLFGSGLFWALYKVSEGRLIGGGDVKLGVVYGLLLGGPINSLLCIFIASTLGTLVALPLVAMGRADKMSKIPFGPYLIIATTVVYLFGASIVGWYRALAGI